MTTNNKTNNNTIMINKAEQIFVTNATGRPTKLEKRADNYGLFALLKLVWDGMEVDQDTCDKVLKIWHDGHPGQTLLWPKAYPLPLGLPSLPPTARFRKDAAQARHVIPDLPTSDDFPSSLEGGSKLVNSSLESPYAAHDETPSHTPPPALSGSVDTIQADDSNSWQHSDMDAYMTLDEEMDIADNTSSSRTLHSDTQMTNSEPAEEGEGADEDTGSANHSQSSSSTGLPKKPRKKKKKSELFTRRKAKPQYLINGIIGENGGEYLIDWVGRSPPSWEPKRLVNKPAEREWRKMKEVQV
ncbi:Hypothetical predicted protein [Lecanosticta acicola]|uniref:Chromo domain-containing protein n=1 Tax=Lecanosticta acicola TaxID=111012 RepID=A0AAI9EE12_9PEZI|nr:Hypothetical predicted protein [Lecanosticta acicola]